MSKVTLYNKTEKAINVLHWGQMIHIPGTSGNDIGQVMVTQKTADAILPKYKEELSLDRPNSGLEKEVLRLRVENSELRETVLNLKAELDKKRK
ncbi:MAG TPA: hypothetical protein DCZ94_21605 [Lentisphaeria bacterium]|nr:MAG: hypothetical protein A2X48_14535 [Lentisphaerae bacterium GWF2_49_21]HBC89542.1 hypothetical protein [Lentisphaeria bacterium]